MTEDELIDAIIALRKEQKANENTNQFQDTMQHNRYKKLADEAIKLQKNQLDSEAKF